MSLRCRELSLADGGREELWDRLHTQLLLWIWRGPWRREADSFEELRAAPQPMAGKETGPHPYNLIHSSTRNCVLPTACKSWEADSSPELPDERPASRHLDFSLMRPQAKPSRTHPGSWPSDLWDNKWKLLSAIKSVVICYTVIENK